MRQLCAPDCDKPFRLAFSPCGRWLYGICWWPVIWDLSTANPEPVWEDTEFNGLLFPRIVVSADGRFLAGAEDRCVVVWDILARTEAKWIQASPDGEHITEVAFSHDGKELLTACHGGQVQRWRTGSWRRKPAFGRDAHGNSVTVSPDARSVATDTFVGKRPGIQLWSYPSGRHRKTVACASKAIDRLTFSPDSSLIASREEFQRVQVWSAKTLAPVASYTPKAKLGKKEPWLVRDFAFHPSGRFLAVTGDGGLVEFVDTTTWELAKAFDWKHKRNTSIAFSPDGTLAAAGSDTGKVVVWDIDL